MADSDRPRAVDPPDLARPRGYSHGVLAPAGARALHVAGQIGWDGDGEMVAGGFAAQFDRALANVLAVVREAGGEPHHLVELTIYVVDRSEYRAELDAVGAAYRRRMGRHWPAMALVEVAGLLEPAARVEIQAVAALPAAGARRDG